MAGLPFPGGSKTEKIHAQFGIILKGRIQIAYYAMIRLRNAQLWDHLERTNPDLFIAYNARMRERNARVPQRVAKPSSPPEVTSARRRKVRGTKKEYRLSPPPYCRPALLPDLNVPVASPQEAAAYANAVFPPTQARPSRAANANAYPSD
ncbi:unnamed protein product [Brassica napus]|uniref:(rape) hypothetical protein n=1 Tax=Brassica napus TaxID=3708 RepID=A0A816X7C7_BRANA|nr:unnamed protein product [Brassica napus]